MRVIVVLMVIVFLAVVIAQRHQQSAVSRMNSTDAQKDSNQPEQSTGEYSEFRLTSAGRGQTDDGKVMSFRNFESKDGIKIFTSSEFHASASSVKTKLAAKLATFSEILEKSDRQVRSELRGERVVGKLVRAETGEEEFWIIRTSGKELSYARSSSLDHLLVFEAWLLNFPKK